MLKTDLITTLQWNTLRSTQPEKWKNSHWIDVFNNNLLSFSKQFNGKVSYYNGGVKTQQDCLLEYSENSPIFHHFKLSPNGYFLYNYVPNNLWKTHYIDDTILDVFNHLNVNKYNQPHHTVNLETTFILFALQSIADRIDLKKLVEIILWAEKIRIHILFKKHPFSSKNDFIDQLFLRLKSKNYVTQYAILVGADVNIDYLIDNCKAVWTFSSGVGFQALLKQKPVVVFKVKSYQADYFPVATVASTPEEAYIAPILPLIDLKRFLSWYYHTLVLDVSSNTFSDKLYSRLDRYFVQKKSIEELFTCSEYIHDIH
jgi:hypothetical protein